MLRQKAAVEACGGRRRWVVAAAAAEGGIITYQVTI